MIIIKLIMVILKKTLYWLSSPRLRPPGAKGLPKSPGPVAGLRYARWPVLCRSARPSTAALKGEIKPGGKNERKGPSERFSSSRAWEGGEIGQRWPTRGLVGHERPFSSASSPAGIRRARNLRFRAGNRKEFIGENRRCRLAG